MWYVIGIAIVIFVIWQVWGNSSFGDKDPNEDKDLWPHLKPGHLSALNANWPKGAWLGAKGGPVPTRRD
jgi:hypothetical protein